MYQAFLFNVSDIFEDENGDPITSPNRNFIVTEKLWKKADDLCFSIQQRYEIGIANAYIGLQDTHNQLDAESLAFLVEIDFRNLTLDNEDFHDSKIKKGKILKLEEKIKEFIKKIDYSDWLFVVIKYKNKKQLDSLDPNEYNRQVSRFMDLSFGTVIYDEELNTPVYQSYSCGDYDSGYYSSSEEFTEDYCSPTEPLIKFQNDQKGITRLIKKFNA